MSLGIGLDPRNGNPLSQAVLAAGETVPPYSQANVVATIDVTVYAPAAVGRYAGAAFMVSRASGTGAITIDGNGVNIDGSTTATMAAAESLRLYLWDPAAGQWTRALVPRLQSSYASSLYLAADLPSSAAVSKRIQDPSLIARSNGVAWNNGNFTTGIGFYTHRQLTILGVMAWVSYDAARDLKVSLWSSVGTQLATRTFTAVSATAGRTYFSFSAPVVLSPKVGSSYYVVGVWETAGVKAMGVTGIANDVTNTNGGNRTYLIRPDVYSNQGLFNGGDLIPNSNGGLTFYPCCPVFSDDGPDDVIDTSL